VRASFSGGSYFIDLVLQRVGRIAFLLLIKKENMWQYILENQRRCSTLITWRSRCWLWPIFFWWCASRNWLLSLCACN